MQAVYNTLVGRAAPSRPLQPVRRAPLSVSARAAGSAPYTPPGRSNTSGAGSGASSGFRSGPVGAPPPADAAALAKRLAELQDLLREAAQIALATGPRGIQRSAQAAAALLSVARDQAERLRAGQPPESPAAVLRKLFERLGATYIKLGQFVASRCGFAVRCWSPGAITDRAGVWFSGHTCILRLATATAPLRSPLVCLPPRQTPPPHAAPPSSPRSTCWSSKSASTPQSLCLSRRSGGWRCRCCCSATRRMAAASLGGRAVHTRAGRAAAVLRRGLTFRVACPALHACRRTVESELGMSLEDVFASVDREPLATASIAQVRPVGASFYVVAWCSVACCSVCQ